MELVNAQMITPRKSSIVNHQKYPAFVPVESMNTGLQRRDVDTKPILEESICLTEAANSYREMNYLLSAHTTVLCLR